MILNFCLEELYNKLFKNSNAKDREITEFITKMQMTEITEKYQIYIKSFFIVLIIILSFVVYVHLNLNEIDEMSYGVLKVGLG